VKKRNPYVPPRFIWILLFEDGSFSSFPTRESAEWWNGTPGPKFRGKVVKYKQA